MSVTEVSQSDYDALCKALDLRAKLRKRMKGRKLTLADKLVILAQIKGLDEFIRRPGVSVNTPKDTQS